MRNMSLDDTHQSLNSRWWLASPLNFVVAGCLVMGLAVVIFGQVVLAQNAEGARVKPGMTAEQLIEILGEPERKSSDRGTVQFWYFGKSMIIVNDGIVQGVSNRGELDNWKRKVVANKVDAVRKPEIGDDWINLWSPPTVNRAEDLKELLK